MTIPLVGVYRRRGSESREADQVQVIQPQPEAADRIQPTVLPLPAIIVLVPDPGCSVIDPVEVPPDNVSIAAPAISLSAADPAAVSTSPDAAP